MSRNTLARALALTVFLASAQGVAQGAPAATDEQLNAWINEGIRLRGERRDEDARAQFQRAWEATGRAEPRAQMALAAQAMGHWIDAERELLQALAAGTDPWIQRNRAHLDAALTELRLHLGSIEVRTQVAGARLLVNGLDQGALPRSAPLRVLTGSVLLEVTAAGHSTARRVVEVHPGDDLLETLDPVPVLAAPPVPAVVVAPVVLPPVLLRAPVVVAEQPADAPVTRRVGVGLLLGSVVVAAGGVATLVWRENAALAFNAPRADPCGVDAGAVRGAAECAGLRTQSDTATALAVASFVTVGALAASGLALVLLRPPSARRSAVVCAPGLASLACGAAF